MFCLVIDMPSAQEVVPRSLVETVCDDEQAPDERLVALAKAASYSAMESDDLRQLEELFGNRGDELYLSCDLVNVLGQFGDKHTLEVLLKYQKLAIRSDKRLFLRFAAVLFRLAVKSKQAIDSDLLPPFRGVLEHRLLEEAAEYHQWSEAECDSPVAAPDPE